MTLQACGEQGALGPEDGPAAAVTGPETTVTDSPGSDIADCVNHPCVAASGIADAAVALATAIGSAFGSLASVAMKLSATLCALVVD